MLNLSLTSFDLTFSESFAVSSNSRTSTECLFIELEQDGLKGYGQASFPPYLKEKREDNLMFIKGLNTERLASPFSIKEVHSYLDSLNPFCFPSKAAIDMALYDLEGKRKGLPVYKLLGIETGKKIYSSFTIGIGGDDHIRKKVREGENFKILKIKMGSDLKYNLHALDLLRSLTDKPIGIDFNAAFRKKEPALELLLKLNEKGVVYAEQPFPAEMEDEQAWLKTKSPVEIFGDESFQTSSDLNKRHQLFHGVNVKLMKCGGIQKALEMHGLAKKLGLRTMLGCMSESALAITAAAHLSPLFDRIDLDGNLVINNDPFIGIKNSSGDISLSDEPGLGVELSGSKIFYN